MKTSAYIIQALFTLIILSSFLLIVSQSVNALNICAGANLLNTSINNPFAWVNGSSGSPYYLFNSSNQTSPTDINTACWQAGVPWEDITIVYKPFPNQCTSEYAAICTEDSENYSTSRTYFTLNVTKRYCVKTDNINWRWAYANGGLKEFQNNYSQICAGGAISIDNSCRGQLYFNTTRNGAVNYSSWNYTRTQFSVYQDVAAFSPTCYGGINGTVLDSVSAPISGVNVTLLIAGPSAEKFFNSTLTDVNGQYNLSSIPATYYHVLFSRSNYNSAVVNAKVNYSNTTQVDAVLSSGSCNYDCTTQADDSRCSKDCDQIAGCNFYNSSVALALDHALLNTQKVILLGGQNYTVTACEGTPVLYTAPSAETTQISCPLGTTLVVLERIVLYNSQPIKIVVPVCRSS